MTFLREYEPKEAGGFREGMPLHDKYHCWATTQYREMVGLTLSSTDGLITLTFDA